MSHTDQCTIARRRAKAKYGFFVHATVYAAVMVLLVIVNLVTSPGDIWLIWPLIGWGSAVVLHGLRVFLLADRNDILDALTERELRQSGMGKPKDGVLRTQPK
ncbi:MAG: 2TM domain-containing protein [Hyphomicrobiales bacterium]